MFALTLLSLSAGALGYSSNFPIYFKPINTDMTYWHVYFKDDNTYGQVGVDPKLSYQENFQLYSDSCVSNCTIYMTDYRANKWEGYFLGVNSQESSYELFNENDNRHTPILVDIDQSQCYTDHGWLFDHHSQNWQFNAYVTDNSNVQQAVYPYIVRDPDANNPSNDPPVMLTTNSSITDGRIYGSFVTSVSC